MLNIQGALKQDRLLRALTGLNRKAFDAVLPTIILFAGSPTSHHAVGGGMKASETTTPIRPPKGNISLQDGVRSLLTRRSTTKLSDQ